MFLMPEERGRKILMAKKVDSKASALPLQSTSRVGVSRGYSRTEPLPEPRPPTGAALLSWVCAHSRAGPRGHSSRHPRQSIRGPAQLPEGQGGKLWVAGVEVPPATSQRAPPPRL